MWTVVQDDQWHLEVTMRYWRINRATPFPFVSKYRSPNIQSQFYMLAESPVEMDPDKWCFPNTPSCSLQP